MLHADFGACSVSSLRFIQEGKLNAGIEYSRLDQKRGEPLRDHEANCIFMKIAFFGSIIRADKAAEVREGRASI